jgi:hypothetical protein
VKGVAITAIGAFTPVGINVAHTMGSLLTKLQWFDDLDLTGSDGEPLTGARVRLHSVEEGVDRYLAMCQFALAECLRESQSHAGGSGAGRGAGRNLRAPLPLLLATSEQRNLPCPAEELLDRVLEAHGDVWDRARSRVFAAGKLGSIQALAAVEGLLRDREIGACYVGGADTLLDPVRLYQLLDDGRLYEGGGAGSDGFIPGEAAVFLRLETPRAPTAQVTIQGSAVCDGPGWAPGAALANAGMTALTEANCAGAALAAITHDGSGDQSSFEEIALALTRLPFGGATSLLPWAPALSVGETGAAGAWLELAMAAFFLREKVFTGPVLSCLTSEGTARAAVVLGVEEEARG